MLGWSGHHRLDPGSETVARDGDSKECVPRAAVSQVLRGRNVGGKTCVYPGSSTCLAQALDNERSSTSNTLVRLDLVLAFMMLAAINRSKVRRAMKKPTENFLA